MIASLGFLGGFLAAVLAFYFLLKYKVKVAKDKRDYLVLELPFLGQIRTKFRVRYSGVFIDEWEEFKDKLERLGRLLEPDFIFHYAKEFGVNYVGLEGDKGDKTLSRGRLTYSALSQDCNGGYNIFLNPFLDQNEIPRRLRKELGEEIRPSEVQAFLFLHET